MQKLYSVLVIDDDEATAFLTARALNKSNVVDVIVQKSDALSALQYLQEIGKSEEALTQGPDFILLDINMPGMDGWEFLDEYKQLSTKLNCHVVLMLTTPLSHDDESRRNKTPEIKAIINKPLTAEKFIEMVNSIG